MPTLQELSKSVYQEFLDAKEALKNINGIVSEPRKEKEPKPRTIRFQNPGGNVEGSIKKSRNDHLDVRAAIPLVSLLLIHGETRRIFLKTSPIAFIVGMIGMTVSSCNLQQPSKTSETPTPYPIIEVDKEAILEELFQLIDAITTKDQLWENLPSMLELCESLYISAFKYLEPKQRTILPLPLNEFETKVLQEIPNATLRENYRQFVQESLSITLHDDQTIAVNTENQVVIHTPDDIAFVKELAKKIPAVLFEELYHTDTNKKAIAFGFYYQDQSFAFTDVDGFGIEDSNTGLKFTYIEEAAAILVVREILQRNGLEANIVTSIFESVAIYLENLMLIQGVDMDTLVALHRASDIDTFLEKLYPTVPVDEYGLDPEVEITALRKIYAMLIFSELMKPIRGQSITVPKGEILHIYANGVLVSE